MVLGNGKAKAKGKAKARAKGAVSEGCMRLIESKKRRLEEEHKELMMAQEAVEVEEQLLDIMQELLAVPEKIPACRRAVMTPMFLKSESEPCWHRTMYYVHRVSHEDLYDILSSMDKRLTLEVCTSLRANNKSNLVRLLLRGAHLSQTSRIASYSRVKRVFKRKMLERHEEHGSALTELEWSNDFGIDWMEQGFFKLLPKLGEGATAADHRYTEIELEALGVKVIWGNAARYSSTTNCTFVSDHNCLRYDDSGVQVCPVPFLKSTLH